MDIKQLIKEIENAQQRKKEIESYLSFKSERVDISFTATRFDAYDNRETIKKIKLSDADLAEILNKELGEIGGFINKYQPMIDTFNAALKGVSDD